MEIRGALASIDITKLSDEQLARISTGEHAWSVLGSALDRELPRHALLRLCRRRQRRIERRRNPTNDCLELRRLSGHSHRLISASMGAVHVAGHVQPSDGFSFRMELADGPITLCRY